MNVNYDVMKLINQKQVDILKEIDRVCNVLGISYYLVHGSLLGAVRRGGFMPFDDDIDIAIKRTDYERFLREAQPIINTNYFIQSVYSDAEYPLEFAKVRDCGTTYIVEGTEHLKINHGIYVDLFPVDFAILGRYDKLMYKLYSLRIVSCFEQKSLSVLQRIKRLIARILCPSIKRAKYKRDEIAKSGKCFEYLRITGGKKEENRIPAEWFADSVFRNFEGLNAPIPSGFDSYLKHIYGNYHERTLTEGKMADENTVVLNASVIDTEMPYTHYTGFVQGE